MPKETPEFMGIKLPNKSYLYLFLGLVNSGLLSLLVSGKLYEYSYIKKSSDLISFNNRNKNLMFQTVIHILKASAMMKSYVESIPKFVSVQKTGNVDIYPIKDIEIQRKNFFV